MAFKALKVCLLQMITLRGHSFVPAPIGRRSIVVDLGAHLGEFSEQIVSHFGCRCIAVEANPKLFESVRAIKGIEPVFGAISHNDGTASFYLSDNPEASTLIRENDTTTGAVTVPTYRLQTILNRHSVGRVDLLKVDIEGAEAQLLLTTPRDVLRSIDQISVEFHDFCGLVSSEEIARIRKRLNRCDFQELCFDDLNSLFVRRDADGIGRLRLWYLYWIIRPARRAKHFTRSILRGFEHGLINLPAAA
jgi:FkbM family methyltransferase